MNRINNRKPINKPFITNENQSFSTNAAPFRKQSCADRGKTLAEIRETMSQFAAKAVYAAVSVD